MWIFCCGMIRSGSTVQYQLASELVESRGLGRRIEYAPEAEFSRVFEKYDAESGFKVFKSHICTPEIRELFASGRASGIYSYRDIRDVTVSSIRKFEMSFDDLLGKRWLDQAIDDFHLWNQLPRMLISRYETMVDDLAGEASRIAAHLNITLADGEALELAGRYSLEKQKERVTAIAEKFRGGGQMFDGHSLLHHNHIRSGARELWKTELKPEQTQVLNERFGNWLRAHGYISK
jgi:hypothetical protein